ncbi:LLM class flavin-dependent oxidoreductase [Rheinheimera sp. 1928-s]|uniref:LLM class flavin-dependent oxidoreductase n=1 Tax=Rheinheimera sp. 1928-s TaxID=3033803 RepID=UPI00260408B4|nr:LLM class flavin-dependent oxidoreductase [Rheinheimera sp. 1928-s]MDF3126447.1 LLM class flavin-dependent oxidoreductase [Rheinheimera sp. 1928-s]
MIPFSILDLAPVASGSTISDSFANSKALAQLADTLGYKRYWLAEHHNMPGIASAATSLLISHLAAATSRIRLGAGGIMLPNHSPLVIAEQFGTLATLYPDRIDLGVGRAPGSDQQTARALRRNRMETEDQFPTDILELQQYFGPVKPNQAVQAVPGQNLNVPLWILGSSLYGAQLAAHLGLPYAFASHFAPAMMEQAAALYRREFKPSAQLDKPYLMLALNVFAAETTAEAQHLFTSPQQQFVNLVRGVPGLLPDPVEDMDQIWQAHEKAYVEKALACSVIGNPVEVKQGLLNFIEQHQPNELMLTSMMHDPKARQTSFRIAAELISD